jgi:hypothetical protein
MLLIFTILPRRGDDNVVSRADASAASRRVEVMEETIPREVKVAVAKLVAVEKEVEAAPVDA